MGRTQLNRERRRLLQQENRRRKLARRRNLRGSKQYRSTYSKALIDPSSGKSVSRRARTVTRHDVSAPNADYNSDAGATAREVASLSVYEDAIKALTIPSGARKKSKEWNDSIALASQRELRKTISRRQDD